MSNASYRIECIGALAVLSYVLFTMRYRQRPVYITYPSELTVRLEMATESAAADQSPPETAAAGASLLETHLDASGLPDAPPQRFLVDSLTLLTCFRHLFGELCPQLTGQHWRHAGFRESFVYLSGLKVDERTYAISHLLPVRFSQQHAAGVRVAQDSNIETFAALDDLQLPLLAHCHSHPGHFGAEATHPSATDRAFQTRLEQGGAIAIGLIFSRTPAGNEAYVRFFAGEAAPFTVEVQGNYVEKIEDHLFRLSVDNHHLPIATIIAR